MNNEHTLYALFNAKTKQITSFTFDISTFPESFLQTLLIKSFSFQELGITDDKINLSRFRWIGDYETGSLVDLVLEKKSIVTESEIHQKYNNLIFSKYKLEDILFELILNSDMTTEKGIELKRFVEKALFKKQSDIEFFSKSDLHIYEPIGTDSQRLENAFKV